MFFVIIYQKGQELLKLFALKWDKTETKGEFEIHSKREILRWVCWSMFPHVRNIEDLLQRVEPTDSLQSFY